MITFITAINGDHFIEIDKFSPLHSWNFSKALVRRINILLFESIFGSILTDS